jgi:hypothetical protein
MLAAPMTAKGQYCGHKREREGERERLRALLSSGRALGSTSAGSEFIMKGFVCPPNSKNEF